MMIKEEHRIRGVIRPASFQQLRVAFTGKLLSMPRCEAYEAIRRAGATVTTSVSRRTNLLVVGMGGWPLLGNGEVSSVLRRAEALNANGARIRIISEEIFLEEVGLKASGPALEKRYSAEEICELTGVDPDKLRRWEQLGLIRSGGGRFDFQDLISLRTVTELIGHGVRPEVINRSLKGLASILPGTERPLTQLQIVLENPGALVADLDGCRITAEGQFMLDFEQAKSRALSLEFDAIEPVDAESWLQRGHRYEENEEFAEAAQAYRRAIGLDPGTAEAYFNLGNALRGQDRLDAAVELFLLAVALDGNLSEAWYNIADVLEEQGRLDEAISSLKQAIAVCPTFADAFYNLALCFEKLGQQSEAQRCWSQYLKLDPVSEWAKVARTHLIGRK